MFDYNWTLYPTLNVWLQLNKLELYHYLVRDGYCIFFLILKVNVILVTHQKYVSQTLFDAIPILNHNVFGIVSLFGLRWVVHIWFFSPQNRCNIHHALKKCITNFNGAILILNQEKLELYRCWFAMDIAYLIIFSKYMQYPSRTKKCASQNLIGAISIMNHK